MIDRYQVVDGSTWNASPGDAMGGRGPIEAALVGTPVADPTRPIEILRVVHAFAPCPACAAHLFDPGAAGPLEIRVRADGEDPMTAVQDTLPGAPAQVPAPAQAVDPAPAGEHAGQGHAAATHEIDRPHERVRLYIWQIPVRFTHWLTAGCIVILSVTGLYIADPFLIPPGGSVMSTVRLIHILTALTFLVSGMIRTYWLLAGNRFARWTAFIPTTKFQATELFRQAGFYGFVRKEIPKVLGHNQLAATAYLALFALLLVEVVTGFALDGLMGAEPGADAVRLASRARRPPDAAAGPPPRDVTRSSRSPCSTSTAACSWTTSRTTASSRASSPGSSSRPARRSSSPATAAPRCWSGRNDPGCGARSWSWASGTSSCATMASGSASCEELRRLAVDHPATVPDGTRLVDGGTLGLGLLDALAGCALPPAARRGRPRPRAPGPSGSCAARRSRTPAGHGPERSTAAWPSCWPSRG